MSEAAESLKRMRKKHGSELERARWKTLREQAQVACPREEVGWNIFCHQQEVFSEVGYWLISQLQLALVCY